jgi:hypothetical protein
MLPSGSVWGQSEKTKSNEQQAVLHHTDLRPLNLRQNDALLCLVFAFIIVQEKFLDKAETTF